MRRLALDVLKGAAILLVVFNHALVWPMRNGDLPSAFAYGTAFGTVAAFAAVAGYVHGFHPPREEGSVLRKRAGQLLVPWAIWAPIYALVPFAWRLVGGGVLPLGMEPLAWVREILLGGGPLWFLTGLFAATAVCAFCDTRTASWWPAAIALFAYASLAIVFSLRNVSPLELGGGTFWAVVPLYVAAFWFGLRVSRDGLPQVQRWVLGVLVAASMIASGVVTVVRAADGDARWLMWLPYAIGVIGGCAALLIAATPVDAEPTPSAWTRKGEILARVGRASLGIYILHPALVAPAVLVARGRGGITVAAGIALGTVALATVAVERLRDVPGLRRAI